MHAFTNASRSALMVLAAAAALTTGLAQAQAPAPARAAAAAAGPQLTVRDVYDRLEAAGYRDIREIEYSHGRYEVKARNAEGARVKLHVNAGTGAVERSRMHD